MGTWGPGIFSDDTALDARDDWLDLVRSGSPPAEASREVASTFQGDDDAHAVAVLAVASVAWKHGRLDEDTRRRALEVITSGIELERWTDSGKAALARRRAALQRLRVQLESPQPPQSRLAPRPQRRPEFPAGSAVAVALGPDEAAVCRVFHHATRAGSFCELEPLAWKKAEPPTGDEARALPPLIVERRLSYGPELPTPMPHRCSLIWRQAERRDPRVRIIARDVFEELHTDHGSDHGFGTVDAFVRHLKELHERERGGSKVSGHA